MKTKKLFFKIIPFLFLGTNGCNTAGPSSAPQEEMPKEIVLIFTRHHQANILQENLFNSTDRLLFYNDSLRLVTQSIDNRTQDDTITVYTTKELLNFKLMHQNVSYHYFFFPGDTIFFNYQDGNPRVSSSNHILSAYDLNLSRYIKERFQEDLQSKGLSFGLPKGETRESLFDVFFLKNKHKSMYLDSLAHESLIRDSIHQFFSAIVQAELYSRSVFPKSFTYPLEKVSLMDIEQFATRSDYLNQVFYHDFLI